MKTMTLFGLLKNYAVLIPALQRNYVHGREDAHAKEVREHFVTSLRCCVGGGEMNLDVVYGNVHDDVILIPIDGQQRLTTLWLSAVYAASMSWDRNDRHENLSLLSRFSYAARPLASTFCSWLTSGVRIDYDTALPLAEDCWGEDPTVRSMITTLRLIHREFKDKVDDLLSVVVGDRIHFEFSDVQGDDSDLYVKINARGKQLTQWENFKGEFARHLEGEVRTGFESSIETLSDKYFEMFKEIPDKAFFSLFGRIADYVLRETGYDPSKKENLARLSSGTECYVPVEEFGLKDSARRIVGPGLRMMAWVLGLDQTVGFWYWEDADRSRPITKVLFAPETDNERDFALFLFEYFRKNENGKGLCENSFRALRLVANVLENVDRERPMKFGEKDYTPGKQFNRIKHLACFLENSGDL